MEARESVASLYERIYPQYKLSDFHYEMAKPLDGFIKGTIKRLIINLPPGHAKSMFASQLAPAAYVGHYPDGQFIGASYNTELAKKFGREVRNIVDSPDYHSVYPDTWLRKDSKSAGRWNTNRNGSYISAAVGKAVTGFRANRLGMDDPHRDFAAGNDVRQTERDWLWFLSLYTRLMPGGGVAAIMQRMSNHDQTARILKMAKDKGENWVHVNFPAITDKKTGKPIRFDGTPSGLKELAAGKVLWPEFFTMDILLDYAKTLGPSQFNAMYQQIPDDLSGRIIREAWLRYWSARDSRAEGRVERPKDFDVVIQSWDLRLKGDSKNDTRTSFVVGQVWGFKGPWAFLLDQVRGQWGFDDSISAIQALSSRWPEARLKLIENKANGPAAETQLRKKLSGLRLVDPLGGDKEARLRACEPEFAAGNVFFPPPETHDFVPGYTQRLLNFPAEPNDEGDATSQALNWRYSKTNKLKALNQL